MPAGYATTFAVTLRPAGGWVNRDRADLERFLRKHCEQWTFYLEYASEDLASCHLHGSISTKRQMRMDNLKKLLCRTLKHWSPESKANLRRSVPGQKKAMTYLYSDWLETYVANNPDKPEPGELYLSRSTGAPWVYSTPADKKTASGYNPTKDYKKKAAAFLADVEEDVLSLSDKRHNGLMWSDLKCAVSNWYDKMVLKGIYTVPSAAQRHSYMLDWLVKFIVHLHKNPDELPDDDPPEVESDSGSDSDSDSDDDLF